MKSKRNKRVIDIIFPITRLLAGYNIYDILKIEWIFR